MSHVSNERISGFARPLGWMRGKYFDLFFIVGLTVFASIAAILTVVNPSLFAGVLFFDIWFLGYHHVVATYTRITFDLESFKKYQFLVIWLPWIVVALTVVFSNYFGGWILATVYLYWQWFHYTRQSFGVARIYKRKSDPTATKPTLLEHLIIYALPVYGILDRSYQKANLFLGMAVKYLPVSQIVLQITGVITIGIIIWWIAVQVRNYFHGRLEVAYVLFVISHLFIFYLAYVGISNIDDGWLCVNIWHNAQYLMIVWMFNNNRFKNQVDPHHKFLSTISKTRNLWIYLAICLGLSTIFYLSLGQILGQLNFLPSVLVVYQAINFHHYIVDGFIWKFGKKTPLKTV